MEATTYDDVVGAIYDAVSDPLRLKFACAEVVNAINATGAHLVGLNKATGEVVLSAITHFSPLGEIDYIERYAKLDPRAPIALAAPVGDWVSCHHHIDQDFVDKSEFYQDFLIPYGSRYASLGKLYETDGHVAVLGVHMGPRERPLNEDQLQFLRRVTPHFQRAMQLIHAHSRLYDQWAIVKATLDSLDYPSLICDRDGALIVGNEAALAILDHGDGISLRNGRLYVRSRVSQQMLHDLLYKDSSAATANNGVPGAILVPRSSGLAHYQLVLRQIEPARSLFARQSDTLWSIMISDPTRTSAMTMRAVAMLYALTPAETRLAALLISGSTAEEVAQETGVKISTIRTQLKSLFGKTGTRRQAELVRLFSAVPAMR